MYHKKAYYLFCNFSEISFHYLLELEILLLEGLLLLLILPHLLHNYRLRVKYHKEHFYVRVYCLIFICQEDCSSFLIDLRKMELLERGNHYRFACRNLIFYGYILVVQRLCLLEVSHMMTSLSIDLFQGHELDEEQVSLIYILQVP